MEILLKSFFYFFIMVTLAGFVSVRAQTESTLMTTVMGMEDSEPMTTEKDEKPDTTTSQNMPEDESTVTEDSGGEGKTTEADGEGTEKMSTEKMGTEKMSTEKVGTGTEIYTGSFTTPQMSTKGESPDGSTPGTEKMSTEKTGTEKMSTEKVGTGTEIYTVSFPIPQMSTKGESPDGSTPGTEKMSTEKTGTEKMSTEKVGTGTEIYTVSFPIPQMSTKGESPDGSTPKQCYTCESEGKDGDDGCAAKQMDDSKTTDCDGNCWITVFYGKSDKFFNISRTCGGQECTSMNQEDFGCKNIEKDDDTKQMCTYCCSKNRCNGMSTSDASYLRYNGIILMVTIIANGLFYCKIL